MAAKIKCPSCGAKNAADSRRCRVCTVIINMDIPEPGSEPVEAMPSAPMDESFDITAIERDRQPTKAKFGSGGGLSARLAAANGGAVPPPTFGSAAGAPDAAGPASAGPPLAPMSGPGVADTFDSGTAGISFDAPAPAPPPLPPIGPTASESFDAGISFDAPAPQAHAPSPPPPPLPESEKFDPDALFRDMGN